MGLTAHDYLDFRFLSMERPEQQSGGTLDLLLRGAEKLENLHIIVEGSVSYAKGYQISGMTSYNGKKYEARVYVTVPASESDFVRLSEELPLVPIPHQEPHSVT